RIVERLGADPGLPDPPAELGADTEDKARRKLERLQREREEMGPVNLRAEVEAAEITAQVDTIVREREELTTAIAKLRGSIGHLNREGRERPAGRGGSGFRRYCTALVPCGKLRHDQHSVA
ncbi:MAG: hypothetical protein J0I30_10385, partial [Burkholderiales bacterium]|nr:hypothetical protein [Burkholderiales bacterium]